MRPVNRSRVMRCSTTLLVVMITFTPVACSESTRSSTGSTPTAAPSATLTATPFPVATTLPAQPPLASDEQALRAPSSSEAVLVAAAHRQQAAYRALGRHPEWDPIVRPGIPRSLLEIYDRNVDARRQLTALDEGEAKGTLA